MFIFISLINYSRFSRIFSSMLFRDLLRLNVGRNHLSEIPSQSLMALKNLNHLDLSANKIYELKGRPFEGKNQ